MNAKEKQEYERFNKSKRIWDSTIDTAFMEGVEKGIEKGIEKSKIETVVLAFKKGLELDDIAELVNMPKESVLDVLKREGLM